MTSVEGVAARDAAAGLRASLFPMEDVSVMGVAEVAASLPSLRRRLSQAAAAVNAAQPDVLLTIDAKGFSFRLTKAVTNEGTTRVHVVSPSWWAWRGGERNLRAARRRHRRGGVPAPVRAGGRAARGPARRRSWATPWWRTSGKAPGVSRGSGGAPRRRGEGGDRDDRPRRVAGEPRPGTRQTPAAVPGSLRGAFEAVAIVEPISKKKRALARLANADAARRVPGAPAPPTQGAPRTRDVAGSRDGDGGGRRRLPDARVVLRRHRRRARRRGYATAQAFAHGVPQVVAYRAHFATGGSPRAGQGVARQSAERRVASLGAGARASRASRATPAALADAAARVLRDERARRADRGAATARSWTRAAPRRRPGAEVAPSLVRGARRARRRRGKTRKKRARRRKKTTRARGRADIID